MFCAPLVAAVPAYATAPALILVGALMCGFTRQGATGTILPKPFPRS